MTIAVDWEVKHQPNQTKKQQHDFTSISGKRGHYFTLISSKILGDLRSFNP